MVIYVIDLCTRGVSMKIIETGVLPHSAFYIASNSNKDQKMFYYLNSIGHFYCTPEYVVERDHFDNFLIMLVKSGQGTLTQHGKTYHFHKDQIVLLDCYESHRYTCSEDMEIYWMHLDGQSSRSFYEEIITHAGNVVDLKNLYIIETQFLRLFDAFNVEKTLIPAQISQSIMTILTELYVASVHDATRSTTKNLVDETINFISRNLTQNITVDELSSRVSLSKYYFTRLFKAETGYTPYEFIIHSRVNASKFYLKSAPSLRVKEICFICGFSSESSFCNTFKHIEGITPSEYRETTV